MMHWYAIPSHKVMNRKTIHLCDMPKEKADLVEEAKSRVHGLIEKIRSLPPLKVDRQEDPDRGHSKHRRRHN